MATTSAHAPSDEEKKLYGEFLAETHKREMAGADNFDKSVLTLSSAGLGLSLSFLKDFVGQGIVWPWVLYGSWVLFVAATLSTMLSFLCSGKALAHGKKQAHRGFMEGDYDAFDERNSWNQWTIGLNYASAASFVLALILTIVFVITNLKERSMTSNTNTSASSPQLLQKGLTVPTMLRPASAPTPPASTPVTPIGGAGGSGK